MIILYIVLIDKIDYNYNKLIYLLLLIYKFKYIIE